MASNIGITGIDSIRFRGKTASELPLRESRIAQEGIVQFAKDQHQHKIEQTKARYPTIPIASIDGYLRECKANLKKTRDFVSEWESRRAEYLGLISMCKHRDKEIEKLDPEADAEVIKDLKRRFPPYDVQAMLKQVKMFERDIKKGHEVCDTEIKQISELNKMRVQCEQRDQELESLGAL